MTIEYIAHPVSGDVQGNLKKIREIVRHINLTESDVVPFVPYYVDLVSMHDHIPQERERGIRNDHTILKSGLVNKIRLYGNRISSGMADEIEVCLQKDILVVPMTDETKKEYSEMFGF